MFQTTNHRPPAETIGAGLAEVDKLLPSGGFKSFGHLLWSVAKAGRRGSPGVDRAMIAVKGWEDLLHKSPNGAYEDSDPDGGVLVPPEYSTGIYTRTLGQNQILKYLSPIPVRNRIYKYPALKEDSRVDGSRHGGVRGYWAGEADQETKSSPDFRMAELMLHRLLVSVFATEELIEDSPLALESYITPIVAAEMNFQVNDAVINGSGVGKPLGVMKAGSKITVAAVTGQGANTIVAANVLSMKNRIAPAFRHEMIWLFNGEAENTLTRMFVATGQYAAANLIYYDDTGQLRMTGSPALLIEQCAAVGTEGDLIAFAPAGYACIVKQMVIEQAISMHLRFDYDESDFKFRFRMDGAVKDDVALTPYKGTNTTSAVVTLNSTRT